MAGELAGFLIAMTLVFGVASAVFMISGAPVVAFVALAVAAPAATMVARARVGAARRRRRDRRPPGA